MGTRSFIAMKTGGVYKAVYCHWDGYPSHNGRILKDHYSDPAKLASLIALGDLSGLGEEIGEKHDFMQRPDGACTFYGRDRGETGVGPKTYYSLKELTEAAAEYDAEYLYLFEHYIGKWWFADVSFGSPTEDQLRPLDSLTFHKD